MPNKRVCWLPMAMTIVASAIGSTTLLAQSTGSFSFETGNDLYAQCTSNKYQDSAYCLGYIAGVIDLRVAVVTAAQQGINIMEAKICIPHDVTQGQAKDVVVDFFKRNPQMRHERASIQVDLALFKAWPCK